MASHPNSEKFKFLSSFSFLKKLIKMQISQLVEISKEKIYPPYSVIQTYNKVTKNLYIIKEGEVDVYKKVIKKQKNNLICEKTQFFKLMNLKSVKKKKEIKICTILGPGIFGRIDYKKTEFCYRTSKKKAKLYVIPVSFILKKFDFFVIKEINKILQLKKLNYSNFILKNHILKKNSGFTIKNIKRRNFKNGKENFSKKIGLISQIPFYKKNTILQTNVIKKSFLIKTSRYSFSLKKKIQDRSIHFIRKKYNSKMLKGPKIYQIKNSIFQIKKLLQNPNQRIRHKKKII